MPGLPDPAQIFSLAGKTAVITGPVSGIGLAIARLFAGAGARLILADIDAPACDSLAQDFGGISIPTDVSDRGDLQKLVSKIRNLECEPDILICNAGISGPASAMHDVAEDILQDLWAVNLMHPVRLCGMIAPIMAQRGGGAIVLLSSIAGLRGNALLGHYGMTKAAIAQLARNLAVEWGPHNIRANAIAPGLIATEWANAVLSDADATKKRMDMTPLRRMGQPEEIAATALYLASDAGAFTNGQVIVVDGGTVITDGN